jgi:hypothetical protein
MGRRAGSMEKLPTTLVQLMKQQIENSKSKIEIHSITKGRESVGSSSLLDEQLNKDDPSLSNSMIVSVIRGRGPITKSPPTLIDLKLVPMKKSTFNPLANETENYSLKDLDNKSPPLTGRISESRLIE